MFLFLVRLIQLYSSHFGLVDSLGFNFLLFNSFKGKSHAWCAIYCSISNASSSLHSSIINALPCNFNNHPLCRGLPSLFFLALAIIIQSLFIAFWNLPIMNLSLFNLAIYAITVDSWTSSILIKWSYPHQCNHVSKVWILVHPVVHWLAITMMMLPSSFRCACNLTSHKPMTYPTTIQAQSR